jgi:hypothetical protein
MVRANLSGVGSYFLRWERADMGHPKRQGQNPRRFGLPLGFARGFGEAGPVSPKNVGARTGHPRD